MTLSILTAEEAVRLVRDGSTLVVGGNGGTGVAESLLEALEARFIAQRKPSNLTLIHVTGVGAVTEKGLCRLAREGLISRVFGSNFGLQLPLMKLIVENRIAGYNLPQGVMAQMFRAQAAKQPGVVTHVGLGTYMEPEQDGGRMNARATDTVVERVKLAGRDWLFYRMPVPDICFLRGTSVDEDGYIAMEHEATTREDLSIAQAVHNAGGTVICQVKRMVKSGTLHPQMVKIPGFLVDHVVIDPDQMQTYTTVYDPSRCGETRIPIAGITPDPLSEKRVIARRASLELRSGEVVNLGVGVSAMMPNVAAEEGIEDMITLTVEAGVIGGVPGYAREFGTAYNPRAIIDQPYQFDFYDGGGLDCAFLSFAEVDIDGNVNVTRFGNRYDGAGGFIDITQNARRLVFSGTMTGGGLRCGFADGEIRIETEGKLAKFVPKVGQISFNGRMARDKGQEVTFVTERAVFRLEADGLVLTEIASGMRLREDIQAQMGFAPRISDKLKEMDPRLFRPGPMGIATELKETRK